MSRTRRYRRCLNPSLPTVRRLALAAALHVVALTHAGTAEAQPTTVPAGFSVVATFHAEGAQIYQCRSGADGGLAWQFREPVATLLEGGRTVGRHYAGPSWELSDGGTLVGRVAEQLSGAGANAIPWLRLDITERRGGGRLEQATAVLRINTAGGVAEGACSTAGELRSVAYAADYVFLAPQARR
ncbi:MAG: hypothetical protein JWR00_1615 [Rubritepida sp.]|nr:hypothetical protein [Rubritepida sp.]